MIYPFTKINSYRYNKLTVFTTKNVDLCSCILHLNDLSNKNCNKFHTSDESSFTKFSFLMLHGLNQLLYACEF